MEYFDFAGGFAGDDHQRPDNVHPFGAQGGQFFKSLFQLRRIEAQFFSARFRLPPGVFLVRRSEDAGAEHGNGLVAVSVRRGRHEHGQSRVALLLGDSRAAGRRRHQHMAHPAVFLAVPDALNQAAEARRRGYDTRLCSRK